MKGFWSLWISHGALEGLWAWGLGEVELGLRVCRVRGLEFRAWGLGFTAWGLGFRV